MVIRKNISISSEEMKKLEPLILKNKGNFSLTIRKIIIFASAVYEKYKSLDVPEEKEKSLVDEYIEEKRGVLIPYPIFIWFLSNIQGLCPDERVIKELYEKKFEIQDLGNFEKTLNEKCRSFGLDLRFDVEHDEEKDEIFLKAFSNDKLLNEYGLILGMAHISQIENYKIGEIERFETYNKTKLVRCLNKEEFYESMLKNFGYLQNIFDSIHKNEDFWKSFLESFDLFKDEIIYIPKFLFEDLLGGEFKPQYFVEFFEQVFKKELGEVQLEDFLEQFRKRFEGMGLVKKIEYNRERIVVFHKYRKKKALDNLMRGIKYLLEQVGMKPEVQILKNMMVFEVPKKVEASRKKPRILIVEDEPDSLIPLKYALETEYEIFEALDGNEALKKVEEEKPHLIILDIMLPKMDGFQVCKILKSKSETRDIPIIILTAKEKTEDKVLGLELGADDYVTKPFDLLELKARVKMILRRSHSW
ncbi:MAG: response regulator [Methanosarcinales archaeon]